MAKLGLYIFPYNSTMYYECAVVEGITLEWAMRKTPGKLTFTVLKENISFQEGDVVTLKYDDVTIFHGFVFTKKRSDYEKITVTAYDQLRYLKNKKTYVYEDKTASQLLQMIAEDFKLEIGDVSDTKYRIPSGVEDNSELFETIQNAIDETVANTKEIYVLYDDAGKLTLKELNEMKLDIIINKESGESFTYTSSIDNSYNRIKLVRQNKKTGNRDVYIAEDTSNQKRWGILQLLETIQENTNAVAKANALLSIHNQKSRNLNIDNVFGDIRVRAGSLIHIMLELGDIVLSNFMIVEQVKHTFKNNEHFMNLRLIGRGFYA